MIPKLRELWRIAFFLVISGANPHGDVAVGQPASKLGFPWSQVLLSASEFFGDLDGLQQRGRETNFKSFDGQKKRSQVLLIW